MYKMWKKKCEKYVKIGKICENILNMWKYVQYVKIYTEPDNMYEIRKKM